MRKIMKVMKRSWKLLLLFKVIVYKDVLEEVAKMSIELNERQRVMKNPFCDEFKMIDKMPRQK